VLREVRERGLREGLERVGVRGESECRDIRKEIGESVRERKIET